MGPMLGVPNASTTGGSRSPLARAATPGLLVALLVGALLLVACSTAPGNELACAECAPLPNGYRLEEYASGLIRPIAMAWLPDGRMLVTEQTGAIRVVENGVLRSKPWASIPNVRAVREGGLIGIAVDPDFNHNHFVYVFYSELAASLGDPDREVLLRLEDQGGFGVNGKRLVDDIPSSPTGSQVGGMLRFGPDGNLYLGTGDAAQDTVAEDLSDPLGKILRLTRDGTAAPDNPFVLAPGADPRVYALGLQNPRDFAFAGADRLYAVDVGDGPQGNDEIYLIHPGMNYGNPSQPATAVAPIYVYQDSAEPFGVEFYAASQLAAFQGNLFVCSTTQGNLRRLLLSGDGRSVVADENISRLCSGGVATGPDGFLYFVDSVHGRILRIRN
jgi:glucose/arabinose dehydrogenase